MNPNLSPKLATLVQDIVNFYEMVLIDEVSGNPDVGYQPGDIYNTYAFRLVHSDEVIFRCVCVEFNATGQIVSRLVSDLRKTLDTFDKNFAFRS